MKTTQIYTNGKSLFTLENYDKVSGTCHFHNITKHSEVNVFQKRAMYEKGQIHYVFGIDDRKHLNNVVLKKGMNIGSFEVC